MCKDRFDLGFVKFLDSCCLLGFSEIFKIRKLLQLIKKNHRKKMICWDI